MFLFDGFDPKNLKLDVVEKYALKILKVAEETPLWLKISFSTALLCKLYVDYKWTKLDSWGLPVVQPKYSQFGTMGHYTYPNGFVEFADAELRDKNRKTIAYYLGISPVIWTVDTDVINEVFVKHFSSFTSRLKPVGSLGQGKDLREALNVVDGGNKWRRIRQTISPSFSNRQLTEMMEISRSRLDVLVEQIENLGGEAINADIVAGKYTMDGTLAAAMGIDMNEDFKNLREFENHPAVRHVNNLNNPGPSLFFFVAIPGLGLLADEIGFSPFNSKTVRWFTNYCRNILGASATDQKNRTFLKIFQKLLIDSENAETAQKGLTKTEIISQIFVIFVAGYETTKTLLQTAFYHLAKDPKLQREILKEVEGIEETFEHMTSKRMPLTCALLNECLRLFCPVGLHLRWCEKDTTIADIPIKKGTNVEIPVDLLHTMEEYWGEDANEFNPNRWIENPDLEKAPFFMPFGAGPRNCIGMRFANVQARLAILRIVSTFEIKFPEEYVPDIEKIRLNTFFLAFSKEIDLEFHRR